MLMLVLPLVILAAASATEDGACKDLHCSHGCKAEKSAAACTCPGDLILGPDSKTCEEPVSLLMMATGRLQLLKEGKTSNDLRPVLTVRSYAFDYYFSKKEIYAFVGDEIIRYSFADANLSAKPLSATHVLDVDTRVTSLAVDWVHSRLYWVCGQRSLVETAGTDGSGRKEVVSYQSKDESPANWADIAVDPYEEKLFWLGFKGLYVSEFTGKYNITSWPLQLEHLTVDINSQLIYIIGFHGNNNLGGHVVVRCRYDGTPVGEEILLNQAGSTVYGLGVVGHRLYWHSNYLGENVYKTDVSNVSSGAKANATVVLLEELYQVVIGFKIYLPEIQQPPKVIK